MIWMGIKEMKTGMLVLFQTGGHITLSSLSVILMDRVVKILSQSIITRHLNSYFNDKTFDSFYFHSYISYLTGWAYRLDYPFIYLWREHMNRNCGSHFIKFYEQTLSHTKTNVCFFHTDSEQEITKTQPLVPEQANMNNAIFNKIQFQF